MTRPTVLLVLGALCLGLTAACDPTGSVLTVDNQWDQAIMVRAVTGSGYGSKLVPPMTGGVVFNTFSTPGEGWSVVVFDDACARLAEVPMDTNSMTIHIGSDGSVTTEPVFMAIPSGVQWGTLAEGSC